MTATVWGDALAEIVEMFQGRDPFNAEEEQAVLRAWQESPAAIMALAEKAGHAYAAGTIRYPWAWLAKAAAEAGKKRPSPSSSANPVLELDQAEVRAGQWMRVTGLHYDRWSEVEDELFGERGVLRPWHSDEKLIEQWRVEWEQARPLGEEVDREEQLRAVRWMASPPARQWSKATEDRVVAMAKQATDAAAEAVVLADLADL